ncbi:hypothetical protein GXW82_11450 [Streptacidiphilus sp. 4-A2]|nr:hypothetical protein [Streptacidiphilus sp. 4-A2]
MAAARAHARPWVVIHHQLTFDPTGERRHRLETAADRARRRSGRTAIS